MNSPLAVVGIGASAGGLNELDEFFKHSAPDTGMAYLVVQHLDPTKKSFLPDLLQRSTSMKVTQARHNQIIRPNQVYVIPPKREMSVFDGKIQLAQSTEVGGLRLPINVLFLSMAKAYANKAIAVVLSGMGSDGTLGMLAIKKKGGHTLVQSPESAQHGDMPQSAITSACVDIVDTSKHLPACVIELLKNSGLPADLSEAVEPDETESQRTIIHLLRSQTGHDFSLYKTSTLLRRIERRISVHRLQGMVQYCAYLEHNPAEVDLLFKELLIGVTRFFRDPAVWQCLQTVALPALLRTFSSGHRIRIWCAGCSTGEEAYSLAMVLTELIEQQAPDRHFELQVFASDISPDSILLARRGMYPLSVSEQISKARLDRFFTQREGYYFVNQSLRDKVLFAQHDLVRDPPFTKLDLLICRNLLIYFDFLLQQRLLPLFHYSLRPNGLMVLGSSETIGNTGNLFAALHSKLRIYTRRSNLNLHGAGSLLNALPPIYTTTREIDVFKSTSNNQTSTPSLQAAADHILLQVYAPAAVVVNSDSDIVYISGRTGKYLEPAAGKANWNFHAMVREGLRAPLYNGLNKAQTQDDLVELHGLQVEPGSPNSLVVNVTVQKLREPAVMRGMFMIVFRDAGVAQDPRGPDESASEGVSSKIMDDLRRQREENHRLREENTVSQEELQSSNEELQSTNEELQSTNEELTTSKEEMQSMNEELQTINAELQAKLDDLALAQSDMQNLLNSTEIAILFLDSQLNVRRYTERAAKIISLRESDVGRPLSDLSSILNYPDLNADATKTLHTLAFSEKEISGSDGRNYSVRIMPYKRLDNVIDGVVITLMGFVG